MSELKATGIYLEGRYYGVVQDYPFTKVRERGPDALQKAVAYRYHREFLIGDQPVIQDYIFPYRGVIQKNESLLGKQPGIYFLRVKHDKYKEFLIRPRNVDEAIEYSPKKEADMVFAIISGDYVPNDFSDSQLNLADIGTDVYLPPIHVDDDPLNMILKLAIRLKGASFANSLLYKSDSDY
ncbi:MAG: hypothetical protein K2F99_06160 [Muribaculaceae bacterium]|nr:hypothetical protein [Muribaculaceae bacterium]